ITNGVNAVSVMGQTAFNSATPHTTQSGMSGVDMLRYDGVNSRLFVAEFKHNRVTVWNATGTITNGQAATNVLGQSVYNSSHSISGVTQSNLFDPPSVFFDTVNHLY